MPTKYLHVIYKLCAGVVAFTLIGSIFGFGSTLGATVIFLCVSVVFTLGASALFERALTDRARSSKPKTIAWVVELNDVEVGEISDAELAAIKRKSFRNLENYFLQAVHIARLVFRVLQQIGIAVPLIVFWGSILVLIVSPGMLPQMTGALQKATPSELLQVGELFLECIAVGGFVVFGICEIFGLPLGFVNCFAAHQVTMIRQHCGASAQGDLKLYPLHEGESIRQAQAV